jgi:dynactin-4
LVHSGLRSEDSTTASHYLQCPSCGWNSNESNISFERPTGLAAQMQKKQQTRRDSIYFNDLKEYYDKCIRHYRGENTNNISKSFGAKLFATSSISRKKPAVLDAFQPSVSLPNDPELDIIDFDLENIELSTLDQKLQQTCTGTHIKDMSKAMPLRFPLRKKQAKLCRLCKKYLIKPDPKSLSIQFVTKLIAWNQLPRFSLLEPLPKLTLNQASEIRLEYLNPTQSYLSMNIDIDQVMNPNVKVDIMSTTLDELCPGKENWSSRDLMKKADYKAIFKCNVTPLVKGDISITLHVNAFYKKFENDQECNSALDCDIEVKLGTI